MTRNPLSLPFESLQVGESFETRGRTIAEADIVAFASLTGDWHPQHSDAVWAAESPFGARIAHGMLLVSYAVGLFPLDPEQVVALRRMEDVVFKRPAFIGDTVRAVGRVEALAPVDERAGLVTLAWRLVNQDGATLVRARTQVLWRRDGAPRSAEAPEPFEQSASSTAVLPL